MTGEENIEVLEQMVEAFNRRDVSALERLWAAEGEYTSSVADLEGSGGVYRSAQIRDYLEQLDGMFDGWQVVEANYEEIGDDRILCVQRVTARAKGSGVPLDLQLGVVYGFRDGLIVSGRTYSTPQEAREAVGLD